MSNESEFKPEENGFKFYIVKCDENVSPYRDDTRVVRNRVICLDNRIEAETSLLYFNRGTCDVDIFGSNTDYGLKVYHECPIKQLINNVEHLPKFFVEKEIETGGTGTNDFILFKLDLANKKVLSAMWFDYALYAMEFCHATNLMNTSNKDVKCVIVETRKHNIGWIDGRVKYLDLPADTYIPEKLNKIWEHKGQTMRHLVDHTNLDWDFFMETIEGKHKLYYSREKRVVGYFMDIAMMKAFKFVQTNGHGTPEEDYYCFELNDTEPTEFKAEPKAEQKAETPEVVEIKDEPQPEAEEVKAEPKEEAELKKEFTLEQILQVKEEYVELNKKVMGFFSNRNDFKQYAEVLDDMFSSIKENTEPDNEIMKHATEAVQALSPLMIYPYVKTVTEEQFTKDAEEIFNKNNKEYAHLMYACLSNAEAFAAFFKNLDIEEQLRFILVAATRFYE